MRPSRFLSSGVLTGVLLLAPGPVAALDDASRWILGEGETPASISRALYPGNTALQAEFLERVRRANPQLGERPAAGTEIIVPDLRRLGPPPPAVPAAEARSVLRLAPPAAEPSRTNPGELPLRLATRLDERGDVAEGERQLMRMEYGLTQAIVTQAQTQRQILERLRMLEQTQEVLRAAAAAPQPPVAPVATPAVTAGDGRPPIVLVASPPMPVPVAEAAAAPVALAPISPLAAATAGAASDNRNLMLAASGLAAAILLLALGAHLARRRWAIPAASDITLIHHEPPPLRRQAGSTVPEVPPMPVDRTPTVAPEGVDRIQDEAASRSEDRSVVELAEMMLEFGKVAGAAEVLRRYIESNPGEALRPWVALLDVYRRAGMPAEFQQAAWRLHAHFNVQVAEWDAASNLSFVAPSLESYPHIIAKIKSSWRSPEALRYLRHLLRDNRAGQRNGFAQEVAEDIALLIDIMECDPQLKATAAPDEKTNQRRVQ